MEIQGNTIYITGAAGGIGSAIAEACVKAGAHVALFDKDTEKLALLAEHLHRLSSTSQIVPVVADLATEAGVQSGIEEALAAFAGQVGVLVSNLGVLITGAFEESTLQDWQQSMALNFFTHVWAIRAVLPYMQQRHQGHIVLMGSDQGRQPDRGLGAYAAAKAAVHSLTKTLAQELPQYGITINCLAPGMTKTPLVDALMATLAQEYGTDVREAERQEIERRGIPLGRLGKPPEVAQAVLFLIQNSFSHGIILPLDGGNTRGM
ncbi:MAG TPA: SDR family oxidoreductase [Ktedonobacteraceae bacterium]|nr:SDR family oxidoreductase [Ktedonobacteraceae bacterium]HZT98210.1 SDR family oxidoreductase [Ktedonobacteraceae bacterium]